MQKSILSHRLRVALSSFALIACPSALFFDLQAFEANRTEDIRRLTNKETVADFRGVAKAAIPTVVSIRVKGVKTAERSLSDAPSDDPFDLFGYGDFWNLFGLPNKKDRAKQKVEGQASGVIVSPNGYILTNSHVVHDMTEIKVQLHDGREFSAKVLGDDPNSELALIQIDAQDLPYLTLGNSDDLEVGQWVAAIGNPFGLQATLTVGVVSAKSRNNLDIAPFEDFIQTDAAINRGNSGGPLITLDGEIIGINTAIATTTSSGYIGIGFAIPSNMAKNFMEEILTQGKVTRGFLGVSLQTIDNGLAQAFGLNKVQGALITNVSKGSAADKAGLKSEDVILMIDNRPVDSAATLRNQIYMLKPQTHVTLSVWRKDQIVKIPVVLGENTEISVSGKVDEASKGSALGIEVAEISEEIAEKNGNIREGVVVTNVSPSSIAALAGLKKGAIILGINRKKVSNVRDFNEALRQTSENQPILLQIKQGNLYLFLSLQRKE